MMDTTSERVKAAIEQLTAEGWNLNEELTTQQLLDALADDSASDTLEHIKKLALDLDLKQVGCSILPDDINRADSKTLGGPLVLQLVEAIDISRPARFQDSHKFTTGDEGDRKSRMLRLKMTDGSKSCIGIEYNPIQTLKSKELIPGVKIKLQNVTLRVGSLLLDSKNVTVLGGRVERLAAAWETQQIYGIHNSLIMNENSTRKSNHEDKPPAFKHYDPTTAPKQADKVKKALAAVHVPTVGVAMAPSSSNPNPLNKNTTAGVTSNKPMGPAVVASDAAKSKLLEKLQAHETERGGRGGRRGGGRKVRRGRFSDDHDDDGTTMTMEEWEASKMKAPPGLNKSLKSDEELARELQQQLDLEDYEEGGHGSDITSSSVLGMFTTDGSRPQHQRGGGRRAGNRGGNRGGNRDSSSTGGRRGRGRGRGRGGRHM